MSLGLTLALDGSTYAGSAALIREHEVIAERQLPQVAKPGREGRAEHFMPMVAECLSDANAAPRDLARVVCGEGPGSFTSLRVAASIAKGLAAGAGIPLFPVSSLLLIVAAADVKDGRWYAVLPAMRGELFAGLFDRKGGAIEQIAAATVIPEERLVDEVDHAHANAIDSGTLPHARGAALILDSIIARGEADIETWEPIYGRLAEAQVKWEALHGRPLV
jgi:tRNA threonylcarbamoyladenosine biosynthesis protein TsaB